jgi:hypothetical protein
VRILRVRHSASRTNTSPCYNSAVLTTRPNAQCGAQCMAGYLQVPADRGREDRSFSIAVADEATTGAIECPADNFAAGARAIEENGVMPHRTTKHNKGT